MDKKLSLKIGEKEFTLHFGANVFFEFYKEDSGHDLVKDPGLELLDLGSIEIFSYLQSMIWAGYQSGCYLKKVEPELTREDVKYFVMSSTEEAATNLLWEIHACTKGMSVEDLKKIAAEGLEKKRLLELTGKS